jgi:ABC-type glycerol-3-phosphate transport system substrate-binding protein
MKRWIVLALLVSLCLPVFGRASQEGGTGGKLVLWDKSEYVAAYNETARARIEKFGRDNNVEVEYVIVPPNDIQAKLLAAIEARNPPDIVITDEFLAKRFAGMDQLVDVSDILGAVKFTKASLDLVYTQSGNYLVPLTAFPAGRYLRKDVWDAKGLPYPTSWQQIYEHAKIVNDPARDFYALGYPMGASGGGDAESMVRSVILAYGGIPVDQDGKVTINSKETLEALNFITRLFKEGLCPPSAVTWDDMGNNTAYLAGSVGTIFNTPSVFNQARTDNPTLYNNTLIMAYPTGPSGKSFCLLSGNAVIIFKNGKATAAAKKYITEFFEINFYKDLILKMGGMWMPVVEGAENDPFWALPENKGWLDNAKIGVPTTYPGPANDLTAGAFAGQFCVKAVQRILLQNQDPQQSLNQLERDLKQALNQ